MPQNNQIPLQFSKLTTKSNQPYSLLSQACCVYAQGWFQDDCSLPGQESASRVLSSSPHLLILFKCPYLTFLTLALVLAKLGEYPIHHFDLLSG